MGCATPASPGIDARDSTREGGVPAGEIFVFQFGAEISHLNFFWAMWAISRSLGRRLTFLVLKRHTDARVLHPRMSQQDCGVCTACCCIAGPCIGF